MDICTYMSLTESFYIFSDSSSDFNWTNRSISMQKYMYKDDAITCTNQVIGCGCVVFEDTEGLLSHTFYGNDSPQS